MTEDELKEIEERCNSATPGPWRSDITEDCDCTMKQQVDIIVPENNSKYPICWYATTNTDFIVHARTDIPKLIAEVRRLREENEKALCFMRDTKRVYHPTTTNSFADDFFERHEVNCDGRCKDPRMARP